MHKWNFGALCELWKLYCQDSWYTQDWLEDLEFNQAVLEERISLYKVEYAVREYCTEVPEEDNVTIEMKDVSDMDNEATNEETTGNW